MTHSVIEALHYINVISPHLKRTITKSLRATVMIKIGGGITGVDALKTVMCHNPTSLFIEPFFTKKNVFHLHLRIQFQASVKKVVCNLNHFQ